MDFIKGIIGLAVLSGPLWLIVLMVPVAIVLAVMVAKQFRNVAAKVVAAVAVLLAVYLALFGDEIVGRMYINHLCETEAGLKVYHTIELPMELWDVNGEPKFITSRGVLRGEVLGDRFKWSNIDEPYIDFIIKISKDRWLLTDNLSKDYLGEKITFVRHYGWLNRLSPAPNVGESCRDIWAVEHGQSLLGIKESEEEREFILQIMIPSTSDK